MNNYQVGQLVSYTSTHRIEYGLIVASHTYECLERYEHQDELVQTYRLTILWPDGVLMISTAPIELLKGVFTVIPQTLS